MKSILIFLTGIVAITSTLSGLMLISNPGGETLGLSTDLLANTPFNNYLVPGLLLTFIVGGINLAALVMIMHRNTGRFN